MMGMDGEVVSVNSVLPARLDDDDDDDDNIKEFIFYHTIILTWL